MTPHVSITLLRTQSDDRLVELIAAGHDRAFDAIVDRYRRPLLRYARRFVGDSAPAEDVVQAAFVSAWAALREGTPVRDLRPWLYRIVHNGALNAMKKPGGEDTPLIEASDMRPGPAAAVEQREDVRRALDTIAALPERQRTALLAVALEGRSHADVGEDLGINDTAVRQLVSRARASLRVAATAVTPWPVAVWMAGVGGSQAVDVAVRSGEVAGGLGAGALFGSGAMKAGAIIAATGAVAVGAPQVARVVHEDSRPAHSAPASATQTRSAAGADTGIGAGTVGTTGNGLSGGSDDRGATRGHDGGRSGADRSRGGGQDDHGSSGGSRDSGRGSGNDDSQSGDRHGGSGRSGSDDAADDSPKSVAPTSTRHGSSDRGSSGSGRSGSDHAEDDSTNHSSGSSDDSSASVPAPAAPQGSDDSSSSDTSGSGSGSHSGGSDSSSGHDGSDSEHSGRSGSSSEDPPKAPEQPDGK